MLTLTAERRAVLAHVIVDPDAWLANAEATLGTERAQMALDEKIARWRTEYDAVKSAAGYKDRAARQAEESALVKARQDAAEAAPPEPTVSDLASALIAKGMLTKADITAAQAADVTPEAPPK